MIGDHLDLVRCSFDTVVPLLFMLTLFVLTSLVLTLLVLTTNPKKLVVTPNSHLDSL